MDGPFDTDPVVQDNAALALAARPLPRKGLHAIDDFGSNPGALRMLVYRPERVQKQPALVVVLHGCGQTAKGYDKGSGWSKLSERGGFLLLYPEQQRANNSRTCFSWYEPNDTRRDGGEVCSIHQMIERVVTDNAVDIHRVFICGLSAGGAMAGAMLATYPETFKAGAIIAGLPYGAARSTSEALESMFTGRLNASKSWGDLVRNASSFEGRWPDVAVWHGTADATVKPINAGEIVKQWTDVHGIGGATPVKEQIGTMTRRAWQDRHGKTRVLDYTVPGMAHGTPLLGLGAVDDGVVGPFFLAAGVWSSLRIAQDWGLFDAEGRPRRGRRFGFLGLGF